MFDEMFEYFSGPPIFTPRPKPGNGSAREATAREGWDGPVDIDAAFEGIAPGEVNDVQCKVIGSMLTSGVPYAEIEEHVANATLQKAEGWGFTTKGDDKKCIWTLEVERECVHDRLAWILKDRYKDLTDPVPAPTWVAPELADTFEEVAQKGGRPAVIPRGSGWHVRNMAWAWSQEAKETGAEDTKEGEEPKKQEPPGASAKPEAPLWPTPYSARPAGAIPVRKRIHGAHYTRGSVTLTAAPGGTGKSQHSLVEAVGMASGYNLIADEPCERLRAWVWNAEDDVDEMERRICGICDHYGIEREELKEWLFIDSGETIPLEFATDNGRVTIRDSAIQTVAARVKALALDVVIFDPLVAIHALQEGDNPSLAKVIRSLRNKVAKPCGCAIELVHHTRKPSKESSSALTADDIRGASSIVYSVRSARILSPMMAPEAEKYAVEGDNRHRYFRVELAKSNTARRGTLHWIELVERPIANGEGGAYGDTVTVCTLWTPPDLTAQVSDVFAAAIRSEIAKGDYRRDRRSGSNWAGLLIGQRMGLDMEKPSHRRQATDVLNWLIKKGVLTTEFRSDKNRKSREFVIPGSPTT
jgi:hypothetical protein